MSLRTDVNKLLDTARNLCLDLAEAEGMLHLLQELKARLDQPLRVAIVGQIKAGKSTFMNALMQADIVYTGDSETTYTVCWFRYGKQPSLTIRFRDGSEIQAEFADLEKWSVRAYAAENPRISDVEYLIVSYPSEVLKQIEFIDTPGLNSVYGTDSQNTMDFLAMRGSENTIKEAGKADAVIFAFQKTFTEEDKKALQEFHGKGNGVTSPINSIGLCTKLDVGGCGWGVKTSEHNPVVTAHPYIRDHVNDPLIKSLLHTVLPVCAKPSEGYMQLDKEDWTLLRQLSEVDPVKLRNALVNATAFGTRSDKLYDESVFGTSENRKRLIDHLGQYGIREITELLHLGKEPEEIGEILQEVCGITAVKKLIIGHFGNRAFLIKTQYIFNRLSEAISTIKYDANSSRELKDVADYIKQEIDRLWVSVQTLKELQVLRQYYSGELSCFSEEEVEDLMRVSGEYGRLPEARLRAPEGSSIYDMMHIAKKKAELWNGKAALGFIFSNTFTTAATTLARSYELMYYHLNALVDE